MTLSRFLRDYLYIPLGGSRHGLPRHLWALLATMLLGGLWHGAGWTFVIWGGLHGLGLAVGALWRRCGMPQIPSWLGWAALMIFLTATWVFFRAPSLAAAVNLFAGMANPGNPGVFRGGRTIAIAALFAVFGPSSQDLVDRLRPWPWLAPVGAAATILMLLRIADRPSYEFIYFHF
jgi:hypothetical protein